MYNEAKKASNAAYLSKFKPVSLRLLPEELAEIQAAAAAAGLSTHKYIIGAVQARMSGKYDKEPDEGAGLLSTELLKRAKAAAAKQGEELGVFLERAIKEAEQRDELERERMERAAAKAKKAEQLQPKEEAKPAFNGDFYARHQEYKSRAKEESN